MSVKISFRKDRNRWEVRYFLNGQRKRPLFREKREAENFARKIRLGLQPESEDSITIDEAGKKYFEIESKRKSKKSQANDRRYINLLHYFMTQVRGIERLASIELEDMEAFRDWLPTLTHEPWPNHRPMRMGPATVNRCLAVLKHFFIKHIHWKNIPDTPCRYLEFLDAEEKPRAVMTGEQYLKVLDAAPDWFKPVLQFIYLTGAPGSCVERLQWSDVDFDNRVICLVRKKGRKAQWKRSPLPMTAQVYSILMTVRDQYPNATGPVFRDYHGRPLLADRISKIGSELIANAGFDGLTLYSLRHALASDLTAANVATEIVRQAMLHSSIATTQRYANKFGHQPVAAALELVRGGKLVASEENEDALETHEDSLKKGVSV